MTIHFGDSTDGRGRSGTQPKASEHPRWRCGPRIGSNGYVRVRVGKTHPLADPNGWAYEHLVCWVSAGRSRPSSSEVIHHINEDKTDNRIENLKVMSRSDHSVMHNPSLSDLSVRQIRDLYSGGFYTMKDLGRRFDVSVSRVSKIIRGETRAAAGGPICRMNRNNPKRTFTA